MSPQVVHIEDSGERATSGEGARGGVNPQRAAAGEAESSEGGKQRAEHWVAGHTSGAANCKDGFAALEFSGGFGGAWPLRLGFGTCRIRGFGSRFRFGFRSRVSVLGLAASLARLGCWLASRRWLVVRWGGCGGWSRVRVCGWCVDELDLGLGFLRNRARGLPPLAPGCGVFDPNPKSSSPTCAGRQPASRAHAATNQHR